MSFKNNRKNENSAVKPWARILALILCILMLGGTVVALIQYFAFGSYAAEISSNQRVRVGLMYGQGVVTSYTLSTDYGFSIGKIEQDSFKSIWKLPNTSITVASDANLNRSGIIYNITGSYNATSVGAYHIEINFGDVLDFQPQYALATEQLSAVTNEVFPAYIAGSYAVRVGNFASIEDAEAFLPLVASVFPGAYVVTPSSTALTVMVSDTGFILFEFDDPTGISALGLYANQQGGSICHLVTPSQKYFEGIFEFKRYINGSRDGVQVVNILSLDQYMNGLLPWEISASWPIEVQKAVAVAARTYALSMLGRHSEFGFDMCNATHCQVYLGTARATEASRRAVAETSGLILTYNGAPAKTYYSAVTGGCTVSVAEAWGGGSNPSYLRAIHTPWEKYTAHSEGEWQTEVTPEQLSNTLRAYGYSEITSPIASARIDKLCQNSTYIYQITFTDEAGNTATITTSDRIRTVLSAYVNSANFVVGRGGENVSVTDFLPNAKYPYATASPTSTSSFAASEGSGTWAATVNGNRQIDGNAVYISGGEGGGVIAGDDLSGVPVATGSGTVSVDIATNGGFAPIDPTSTVTVNNSAYIATLADFPTYQSQRLVLANGKASNFVFVGRGWGHGVGMSQWGAKNLADMGYDFCTILRTYYPGTEITTLR
ncbi:MAG TPA: SpoIID/LytB domain-containing protein [Clostridiales bacterium]|jgi:stage II sporulation protein D|nr:SpoIID/LytB domain-containing protein [Clostridiales bacterium]